MGLPYVKKFDKQGNITNPITKENPYLFEAKKINLGQRFWRIVRNRYFAGKSIISF
jgi:hypothetical protein